MAKYKQRKDGRYYTMVNTGKFDENGKAIRISLYAKTSKELEKKVAAVKTDLDRGTYADDKGKTFGVYAREWFEAYKKGIVAAATARDYNNIIKNHLGSLSDMRLKEILKTDVQAQVNAVDSPEIKRRIVLTVKQVLECAIDDGYIYRNPARSIKLPAVPQAEKRALTPEEKKAIKECDFTLMEAAFVNIAFGCGLRRGEILGLMKKDIDFENKKIHVRRSLSFVNSVSELKEPKSKGSKRSVDAPEWVLNALKPYCSEIHSLYLFHGQNGAVISHATYRRMWKRIFNKINTKLGGSENLIVTDITPHMFRHNYATMLYYAGIDVKEAQRLLGHSSVRITLEIYTHLIDSDQSVKEKINSIAL